MHSDAANREHRLDAVVSFRERRLQRSRYGLQPRETSVRRIYARLEPHGHRATDPSCDRPAHVRDGVADLGVRGIEAEKALAVVHHGDERRSIEQGAFDVGPVLREQRIELLCDVDARVERDDLKS
ncbi:MAG: hypothetical protein EXR75_03060 [Myxococcales bacterium]|nr:hypothetical protein [Myxococcales bacterium]